MSAVHALAPPITAANDAIGRAVYETIFQDCDVTPWEALQDCRKWRYIHAGNNARALPRGGEA